MTDTKYITCNYQGRLGNLMFEIAATLAAAWNNNAIPCFPQKYNSYYRDLPAFQEYILPIVSKFYQYKKHELSFKDYNESADLNFKPIVAEENIKLVGYFTSSLYFDKYRSKIIELFSTNFDEVYEAMTKLEILKLDLPKDRTRVSVHVRRQDYVTDYKWDLPISYYQDAATYFHNPTWVIFSDDKKWCEDNLSFMSDKVFVNEKDYIEIQLMGKCDAHIAANSTFSAMGIILGDKDKTKKVIAPKNWCPTLFNKNIYENHWTII